MCKSIKKQLDSRQKEILKEENKGRTINFAQLPTVKP